MSLLHSWFRNIVVTNRYGQQLLDGTKGILKHRKVGRLRVITTTRVCLQSCSEGGPQFRDKIIRWAPDVMDNERFGTPCRRVRKKQIVVTV